MHWRNGLIMGTAALLAAGCGSTSSSSPAGGGASTPTTVGVQIDSKTDAFNAFFTAYFPNEVKVHAGDTVMFTSVFRGEPHTVALGSLIDSGLKTYDAKQAAAGPGAHVDDSEIPELAKVPDVFPQSPTADANQAAAQPCYLDSGPPPGEGPTACPQKAQPDFTGAQSFYNSGYLPDAATFPVKLASSIKPGTYRYMCAVHRTQMTGKIDVVASDTPVTSADDAKKMADDQLQKKVAAVQPGVEKALQSTEPGKVVAGVAARGADDILGTVFAPKAISIPVGGAATWTLFGFHSVAFNAPEDATPIINKAPDGTVHLNQKAGAPTGTKGVPPPPPGPPPSPAPGAPAGGPPTVAKTVDLGAYGGTGFWNSGIIQSFPPELTSFKISFPKAGTYKYKCLVHKDMEGTVKVG